MFVFSYKSILIHFISHSIVICLVISQDNAHLELSYSLVADYKLNFNALWMY